MLLVKKIVYAPHGEIKEGNSFNASTVTDEGGKTLEKFHITCHIKISRIDHFVKLQLKATRNKRMAPSIATNEFLPTIFKLK